MSKPADVDSSIYKTIVENLDMEIFVTDGDGNILFVNSESVKINELEVDNIIGRNVRDLLDEGYFRESSTLQVLREQKTVSVLQHLRGGRQIIATGVPVFDEEQNINMVITTSQDIEAVNELMDTLNQQQEELQQLKQELFETGDILYLANQYISKYNDKYKTKKIFSRDALGKLVSYTWPGSLTEMDQTIEKAYTMTDGPVIRGETVHAVLHSSSGENDSRVSVYCEDIIPLKEAKHQLEEQLVKRAYEVYGTTHKTAEALGVNQSTVSRILNKYQK